MWGYRLSRRRTGSLPRAPASARAVAPVAVATGIRVSHLAPECVNCKTTLTHANVARTAQTGQRPFLNSRRSPRQKLWRVLLPAQLAEDFRIRLVEKRQERNHRPGYIFQQDGRHLSRFTEDPAVALGFDT